ncbi:MAG TPA: hypothetical protein EYQ50_03380 [Verrucomicrobiales bacterium]|nr:hypothetical protein [Verrucomicrobiales bacterium]HIL70313.1 hypothetical protein [Verrucomicrobiota bacterium]
MNAIFVNPKQKLTVFILMCLTVLAQAQSGKSEPETWRTVSVQLHPANLPRPSLKYVLLPEIDRQKLGNAALAYSVIFGLTGNNTFADQINRASEWNKLPLSEIPTRECKKLLSENQLVLEKLERAARYRDCNWQVEIREDGLNALLPHLSRMKGLSQLLVLKIRVAIAGKDPESAIASLKSGMAMAGHIATDETLIGSLMARSVAELLLEQVVHLIQLPNAPNLYWALTDLPRPFFDVRRSLLWERDVLFMAVPELRGIEHLKYSNAQWKSLFRKILNSFSSDSHSEGDFLMTGKALLDYPPAKKRLEHSGLSRAEINQMPVIKVMLLAAMDNYLYHRDNLLRWSTVPYWQAWQRIEESTAQLDQSRQKFNGTLPFYDLLPAVTKTYFRFAILERRIDELRILEALRLYAGSSGAGLPESLDQIKEVPIPLNPMTGELFIYERTGEGSVLKATLPTNHSRGPKDRVQYNIQIH